MTQLHNKIFKYRPLCVTINNKELHLIHCYIAVVIMVEYVVNPSESNEYFQPFLFFYFIEKKRREKI